MKVIRGLKHLKRPSRGSCVAIGVFDGVHIGHQKIIKAVVQAAREKGLASIVLTFDPHPSRILRPDSKTPSLISLDHRIKLIEKLGADILIVLKFTKAFASMPAEKFVKNILINKLGAREIVVGENFYFGRGGGSGARALTSLRASPEGERSNLKKRLLRRPFRPIRNDGRLQVNVIEPVKIAGSIVSSSRIRKLIIEGILREAEILLGRPVSVLGTVVSGARIGRCLGYPTANINPHHEVIPPSGVYAVKAGIDGRLYGGVLNIGTKPTFYAPRDMEPAIEVNIFGFNKHIYGRDIEVRFVKKLRDEIRFRKIEDLVAQIRKDTALARKILKGV